MIQEQQKLKGKDKVMAYAIAISFLLHGAGLLFKLHDKLTLMDPPAGQKRQKVVKIRLMPKTFKKNLRKKQIVATEKTGRIERPDDSRFLSETNQKFDRQTVAKGIGSFKMTGKGIRTGSETPSVAQVKKTEKKAIKKKKLSKVKKKISFKDLALAATEIKPKRTPDAKEIKALGLESGKLDTVGLSKNNDFVDDIPLGDMTHLNTVEFKYYGFYHRIKQKLEQHWGYNLRKKATALYRSGRRMPASENMITSLVISLDGKGNIVSINVKSTSGVRELDDVAIESFNKAGPFPNPPKGMVKNGVATIEWGFVVKG